MIGCGIITALSIRLIDLLYFVISKYLSSSAMVQSAVYALISVVFIAFGHFVSLTYLNDFNYFTKIDYSLHLFGYVAAFELIVWDLLVRPWVMMGVEKIEDTLSKK